MYGIKLGFFVFLLCIVSITFPSCESRAVNISNTWTLPQEGFSVFYRFFRDKISWFEADAVCQFHHANLVTVDTRTQSDAVRAFLKELDVTEPVWIGLMRAQNANKFTWTNSKTLQAGNEQWVEVITTNETPLCAVIDPDIDYRWHALRCGGPETAAFLCELPVPLWASKCTITSIPSLTIQYLSDTGVVQLSRDCGEEGSKQVSCRGHKDRNTLLEQLQCLEDESAVPGESNLLTPDFLQIEQKKIEKIFTTTAENMEEMNSNQIENTVRSVMNKISLEDMMIGDQPADTKDNFKKEYEKKKKYTEKKDPIKETKKPVKVNKENDEDEQMTDDEPIEEPRALPVVVQAHKTATEEQKIDQTLSTTELITTEAPSTQTVHQQTETEELTTKTSEDVTSLSSKAQEELTTKAATEISSTDYSSTNPTTIVTTSLPVTHILPTTPKKEISQIGDHFIPPLLLIKTKFTLTPTSTTTELPTTTTESHTTHAPPTTEEPKTEKPTPEATTIILNEEIFTIPENGTEVQVVEFSEKTSLAEEVQTTKITTLPDLTTEHQHVEITFEDKELGTMTITTRPAPPQTNSVELSEALSTISHENLSTEEHDEHEHENEHDEHDEHEEHDLHNNFSNIENYQPYKPNRHRVLTKPDTGNYIKKILG